jgi:hypothetical protein
MQNSPLSRPRAIFTSIGASALFGALLCTSMLYATAPASALSEIKREELPAASGTGQDNSVPFPDPVQTVPPAESEPETPAPAAPDQVAPEMDDDADSVARPHLDPNEPLPEIQYDLAKLPEAVRRMHDLIVEAAKTGDIEKLRPLVGIGDDATQLSLSEVDGDPIEFLKGLSGDSEGQEILAILEETLGAGYVHLDAGTPQELYVWPYFFAVPLEKLDPRQRVELFKLVTAGDYEDMKSFGTYTFYRAGITPDGQWTFFVAGE